MNNGGDPMTIERKKNMTKESIDRINELARKSKTVGLTEEELEME